MNKTKTSGRFSSMEVCKMVAAIFVVFIHVQFPGNFGAVMNCLARFAVPVFFAISGFFSLGIDGSTALRRMGHIMKLELFGSLLYALWYGWHSRMILASGFLEPLPYYLSAEKLLKWLILNDNPFSRQLWYLSAMVLCYLILWLYVRKGPKSMLPLYCFGIAAIILHVLLSTGAMLLNIYVPMMYYRNGLLFGLPMFLMGMFIREHREELSRRFAPSKLWLLVSLGTALSLIQWFSLGTIDLPMGMLITAFSLMLLMAEKPQFPLPDRLTTLLGDVSLTVYIIHYLLYLVLLAYAGGYPFLAALRDSFTLPVVIGAVSVVLGFIYAVIKQKIQEQSV